MLDLFSEHALESTQGGPNVQTAPETGGLNYESPVTNFD